MGTSMPDVEDLRAASQSVAQIAAFKLLEMLALSEGGRNEPVRALYSTANLFDLLKAQPTMGRTFSIAEDQPGNANVAILSHALWQQRFGGASEIVGRAIKIESHVYNVIGVLPPSFNLFGAELFLPLAARTSNDVQNRDARNLQVFARLKPEASLAQAQTELAGIARGLAASYPATNRAIGVRVVSLREWYGGEYRKTGALLFGAVLLVLLVACANVAGLLLARGVERQKEMAVRLALGATRGRILQQLLTESLLLAVGGGALGVLLAVWLVAGLNIMIPVHYGWRFAVDGAALLFALALSVLTACLSGLFPAWQTTRPDVQQSLKEGVVKSRRSHHLRNALIIGNVAVSLVLLVGTGLLLRSVWNWQHIDLGFDPNGTVTMWLNLSAYKYRRTSDAEHFNTRILQRVQGLPGVQHAATAHNFDGPPREEGSLGFTVAGATPQLGNDDPAVLSTAVTEDYFAARGIRLIRGRAFTNADSAGAVGVAVVNEKLARTFFGQNEAVGGQLKFGGRNSNLPWLTIVGVIADVRHPNRLEISEVPLDIYIPLAQQSVILGWQQDEARMRYLSLIARTAGDAQSLKAALPREIWALDPEQPIQLDRHVRTMQENVQLDSFEKRALAWLLGAFALTALGLAASGLAGLLARYVAERTHEIGIRTALGAQTADILRLVVWQGLKLTLLGVILGFATAFALARWLESMLFEVRPHDPLTFALIPLLLTVVALLACWLPARRATRVDPLIALRSE